MRSGRSTGALKLCNRGLVTLPSCVFEETLCDDEKFWEVCSLTKIDLSHNLLMSVAGDWGRLSELTVVRLTHNRLSGTLPEALGELPALHTLDAADNELEHLPRRFASARLRCVLVARNKLVEWPEFAGPLEEVDATDNRLLGALPEDRRSLLDLKASGIGLRGELPTAGAEKIHSAHLSRNYISHVSSWPLSLVYVNLRENCLGPSLDLEGCRASRILLGHNAIVEIVFKSPLQNVSTLDLSNNKLRHLNVVDNAEKLPRLKSLDVCNNDLATLPSYLGFIHTLCRIQLL